MLSLKMNRTLGKYETISRKNVAIMSYVFDHLLCYYNFVHVFTPLVFLESCGSRNWVSINILIKVIRVTNIEIKTSVIG